VAIRGVLFDLDGTLWEKGGAEGKPGFDWADITAIQASGLAPHFDEWGFNCDPAAFVEAFLVDLRALLNPPTADHREPSWYPALCQTMSRFGSVADETKADVIFDIVNDVPFHHFGVQPFPDSAPALKALAARGLKLGAVTNNPKKASRLLREARDQGLPDVLEVMISSLDCGWRKPHHVPFQLALDALGLRPEETVYVGDTYENDVVPALELGMTAVLRVPPDSPAQPGARHYTITSLLDLRTLLDDPLANAHPNRARQAGL